MPPRNPELPEGTDHIINGAAEMGGGSETTSGLGGSTAAGGGTGSGFVGSGGSDDTGGMSAGGIGGSTGSSGTSGLGTAGGAGGMGGSTGSTGLGGSGGGMGGGSGGSGGSMGSSGGGSGGDIKTQLREGVSSMQEQAGQKVREYAETGKTRATTALDDLSQVVSDAAGSIDERLGAEYGEYARRAADAVSGLADSLRDREVDQLFEDGRNLVRKSPGVALGAAAVVGFTLMRLIKSGMDSGGGRGGEVEVEFQPDPALSSSGTDTTGSSGSTSRTGV